MTDHLTPAQIAALADFADDAAGVPDEPLPAWMTVGIPARVELERHHLAEAVIVATDNRGPCPTVQVVLGEDLAPVTLAASAVLS